MKITILSFSNRSNGNCQSIAKLAAEAYDADDVQVFSFSSFALTPCGNCDNACFHERMDCPYIDDNTYRIYERITESDLAIFVVPNYCGYPCSNFFVWNERGLCYFSGHSELLDKYEAVRKQFIAVSNTDAAQLIAAFCYHTNEMPEILVLSAKAYGRSSLAGDLMCSEAARMAVLDFLGKVGE